jgi:hypothetical protein
MAFSLGGRPHIRNPNRSGTVQSRLSPWDCPDGVLAAISEDG